MRNIEFRLSLKDCLKCINYLDKMLFSQNLRIKVSPSVILVTLKKKTLDPSSDSVAMCIEFIFCCARKLSKVEKTFK